MADCEALRGGGHPASYDKYIPDIQKARNPVRLFGRGVVVCIREDAVRERLRTTEWQLGEDIKSLLAEGQLAAG